MSEPFHPKIVSDPQAADTLINPISLRQLAPFFEAKTVSEVARSTGDKPNTVLARVRRFVKLGLLEVKREEKRAGRAVKYYQTTAKIFFVPFEATSAEDLTRMMHERDSYWETLLRRGVVQARAEDVGTWGTRIYKDSRGRLQVQTAVTEDKNHTMLDPDRPAALSAWRDSVYLDFEDAKALQQEMFALLKRYHQKKGAQRYILRLGIAPVHD